MRLTHIHIFLVGWAYYLGVPVIAAYTGVFDSVGFAWPWLRFVDIGSPWQWALPLYTVLMPIAFYWGDKLSCRIKRIKPQITQVRLANRVLLPIYALLLLLFIALAREMLFSGYVEGFDSSLIMGPIATLQMMILFQYLLCKSSGNRTAARLNMLLLLLSSLILLGMGGRLYVITSLVAIYFHYWNWGAKNARERRRSLLWVFVIPIPFAIIGMWRFGMSDFNIWSLFINLFVEPFFTSISAFSFLQSGNWNLLDIPQEFFFAFLNIVPSAIWTDKLEFFSSLASEDIASPFGAMSIVASTVRNFGFVGGLIFVAFIGFIVGRSQRNANSPVAKALYCYLVSLIMFIFFRDPFQIQVKLVLTGFLLAWLYRAASKISTPTKTASTHNLNLGVENQGSRKDV